MYRSYIGLEIHIQLLTKTKIFCACRSAFGDEPNTNICPVCMGYPGALPALNQAAIKMAYVVAQALNCSLAPVTMFDRKNYFYPDLPKNYQISQYHSPVGRDGFVELQFHKKKKRIRIHDVHLEEDAGKMIHAGDLSLLDYNRTGTPLLEIVTEPDLEIGEEAEIFLQNFRRLVRYLGVCDGNMEEGSMRCDANVSVNLRGKGLGSKVEIKNLNSSKFVKKALNFEIARHQEILERGGTISQETRLWNENRDLTVSMRSKEEANDYRYFPDPDLPPFRTTVEFLTNVKKALVELPLARKKRMIAEYGLTELHAEFITDEKETADFFEECANLSADPSQIALWLSGDVQKLLNREGLTLAASPLTPKRLADLLILLERKKIHGKIAKQVLQTVFKEDRDPKEIIKDKGWEQITDQGELSSIVEAVMASHPQAVRAIQEGDAKPMGFLVGQIMKKTKGLADPQLVQEILKEMFSLSVIQVFSMGGGISAVKQEGLLVASRLEDLGSLFQDEPALLEKIRFEEVELNTTLSEEITPEDWARLISSVNGKLEDGETSGIVIAHGTDTLAYTASLLHWIFGNSQKPIVLAASVQGGNPQAAKKPLRQAIIQASSQPGGIRVIIDDKELPALNLKFEKVEAGGFRNWNQQNQASLNRHHNGLALDFGFSSLKQRLEEAINKSFVAKVFPGMRADSLISLIDSGIRYFILELFDTGTANLRSTPFSLKKAFNYGKERGALFFCTSQQEGIVDFSEYITSHELWKEGALPMGALTTESAFTKLIASLLVVKNDEELTRTMEE